MGLQVRIDNEELDIDSSSDFPITFDYQLEDSQDFQRKKSSESIGLKIPATLKNQKILNTFHNTSVEDYSTGKNFKNIRSIVVESEGTEIFIGKAIPKKSVRKGNIPISYEINCFGNNADWIIDLKELTLYDIFKHIEFVFDKKTIEDSWKFDGTNENLPYVFAPVKYGGWMDPDISADSNYSIKTMKPSLSVYWLLFWGFKSIGYKIKSIFFDTPYFRRLVIPWSFGAFLTSEGTKHKIHHILAKTNGGDKWFDYDGSKYVDLAVLDNVDSSCYDNNNTVYEGDYTGNNGIHGGGTDMIWKYNTPHYGPLEVVMKLSLFYDYKIDRSSDIRLEVHWFHYNAQNGQTTQFITAVKDDEAPTAGETGGSDLKSIWKSFIIYPNDIVTCKVWLRLYPSKTSNVCRCKLRVDEYKTDYFRVPVGGTITFDSYLTLQKEKFTDVLCGIADLFNLSIQTDPINKEVLIEPTHKYSLDNTIVNMNEGYFTDNMINWTEKEDISKESEVEIYDDNAREFVFKFKDDGNDGALKIVQDRYKIALASGKYVFDERFKADKKEFENRYFSPAMHYLVDDFQGITGISPQMVCLVPENISNTSSPEAQNTFSPKICFYKGLVSGVGGWRFNGINYASYPYMFSVNYKTGGENDPILSYSDEKIGNDGSYIVGTGLIKRFFWQRLAIMNNGQWLNSQFNLTNTDIVNWFHREKIAINGELWELLNIKGYNSLTEESTKCVLRKWVPVTQREQKNTFPSKTSILTDAVEVVESPNESEGNEIDKVFDSQYSRLVCLYTDIPK